MTNITTLYSPVKQYLCPRCSSELIRFVFDAECDGLTSGAKLIKSKKGILHDSFDEYVRASEAPKWICKECFDCGIVVPGKIRHNSSKSMHTIDRSDNN